MRCSLDRVQIICCEYYHSISTEVSLVANETRLRIKVELKTIPNIVESTRGIVGVVVGGLVGTIVLVVMVVGAVIFEATSGNVWSSGRLQKLISFRPLGISWRDETEPAKWAECEP